MKDKLAKMLMDLINDDTDAASAALHEYLTSKIRNKLVEAALLDRDGRRAIDDGSRIVVDQRELIVAYAFARVAVSAPQLGSGRSAGREDPERHRSVQQR